MADPKRHLGQGPEATRPTRPADTSRKNIVTGKLHGEADQTEADDPDTLEVLAAAVQGRIPLGPYAGSYDPRPGKGTLDGPDRALGDPTPRRDSDVDGVRGHPRAADAHFAVPTSASISATFFGIAAVSTSRPAAAHHVVLDADAAEAAATVHREP